MPYAMSRGQRITGGSSLAPMYEPLGLATVTLSTEPAHRPVTALSKRQLQNSEM